MFSQASVILFTDGCVCGRHPPPLPGRHPPAQCMFGYPPPSQAATAADCTHPTGMHSCQIRCS